MRLYKLRERQSRGPGCAQGALPAPAVPLSPLLPVDRSRGQRGHEHRVPWGEKWGWGYPPNSWAGRAPRLASSKATLATCLLTASNKWHIPGASPAGERQKGRLEGLCSSSEVGGKLLPCCLKFHHLKYLPLPVLSCWSHSTTQSRALTKPAPKREQLWF